MTILKIAPIGTPVLRQRAREVTAQELCQPELQTFVGEMATWTSGLATVGKLAEPIPTVGRSAGSVLGFPDLVQKAIADELAGKQQWVDFAPSGGSEDYPIDLDPLLGTRAQVCPPFSVRKITSCPSTESLNAMPRSASQNAMASKNAFGSVFENCSDHFWPASTVL